MILRFLVSERWHGQFLLASLIGIVIGVLILLLVLDLYTALLVSLSLSLGIIVGWTLRSALEPRTHNGPAQDPSLPPF